MERSRTVQPGFWRGNANIQFWLELFAIAVLFTCWAGLPPDVNESHYLTKARHFWDPDWCPGDLFLGSAFAHWFFYASAGWLTQVGSLEFSAWLGRAVASILLAAGWVRTVNCLCQANGAALFSAVLFLLLNTRFNLAGEWVVGGFEAKGFAYAFVLFAIANLLQGKWSWAWLCIGLASAFHVLVGGWASFAILFGLGIGVSPANWFSSARPHLAAVLAGGCLALLGIVPPLLQGWGVDPELAQAANAIYVKERLVHHLAFEGFQTSSIARFALITALWAVFAWKNSDPGIRLINRICAGSLCISFFGLLLSGVAEPGDDGFAKLATNLLRFYWFRIADFAIPLGLAIMVARTVFEWLPKDSPSLSRTITAASAIVLVFFALGLHVAEMTLDWRPNADKRTLPSFVNQPKRTYENYQNWVKVCRWIRDNTAPDAVFVTPNQQQTFKWYAGRSEVVCWKDIPQDAPSIIQWRERVGTLIRPQKNSDLGLMQFSDQQLRELGERYGAEFLIVPQGELDRIGQTALRQVYPEHSSKRTSYVVLQLD